MGKQKYRNNTTATFLGVLNQIKTAALEKEGSLNDVILSLKGLGGFTKAKNCTFVLGPANTKT